MATGVGLESGAVVGELVASLLTVAAAGTYPPVHLLSDEKFACLAGERIYLFLVSQGELIWYGEWMDNTDEATFQSTINRFLTTMDEVGQVSGQLATEEFYAPASVTTDGWRPVQNAWKTEIPDVDLIECNLHGKKRVSETLDEFAKAHPEYSAAQLQQVKENLEAVFEASSLAEFSQRIRRNRERYEDDPILRQRLDILKEKRFLFTNHFKYEEASAYSAPLDRSMRFLNEKLESSGQYRAADAIDPMLNAWAIVNNLRKFLPDAKKAGQSLAEFFGAQLHGIPWMEALNLCTVGNLDALIPSPT
jgi:hypothetical protein